MKFYDRAELGKYTITPEGYLHGMFPITRPGVFTYLRGDGISQVAKLPDEIFSDTTIQSANNKPLTNDHPSVGVTVDNYNDLAVGMTDSNAHVEDNKLVVGATITDKQTINKIKNGKRELSIGFVADVPEEHGQYGGAEYDAAQRNIKINHIAVVQNGRAGHDVSIHDSAAFIMDGQAKQGGETMPAHLIIDSQSHDVDQVVADSYDDIKKKLAAAEAEVAKYKKQLSGSQDDAKSSKKEADSLRGERDSLQTQIKDLKAKELDQDGLDNRINARLELQTSATRFVGDSYDFKGKSDRDVKVDAIKAVNDSFDEADKSDDYIDAFYDSTVATADNQGFNAQGHKGKKVIGDSVDDLRAARANAYK